MDLNNNSGMQSTIQLQKLLLGDGDFNQRNIIDNLIHDSIHHQNNIESSSSSLLSSYTHMPYTSHHHHHQNQDNSSTPHSQHRLFYLNSTAKHNDMQQSNDYYQTSSLNQHHLNLYDFSNHSSNTNDASHANNLEQQQVILMLNDGNEQIEFNDHLQANETGLLDTNEDSVQGLFQHSQSHQNNIETNVKPKTISNRYLKKNLNRSSTRTQPITIQQANTNSVIVPSIKNVDEIFYSLSQKIAKYCQVLADLTNCEVFYKAQLPSSQTQTNRINSSGVETTSSSPIASEQNNTTHARQESTQTKKYMKKSATRANQTKRRSLYWGTHQMLFEYSHNNGLKYDRTGGDSLIKINSRSISNDMINLIEEIVNDSNTMPSNNGLSNVSPASSSHPSCLVNKKLQKYTSAANSKKISVKTKENNDVKFKDCCIFLKRLDENLVDSYLEKFEINKNDYLNDDYFKSIDLKLPNEDELYSDEYKLDYIQEDEEDVYECDQCDKTSYRHLTQFKLHHLKTHNLEYHANFSRQHQQQRHDIFEYECSKCKYNLFETHLDFIKHLLVCYYPDIYTCKTCHQSFDNYNQYLFHSTYIHTQIVYMCSICRRKFKSYKGLLDHDVLMHKKIFNTCQICFLDVIKRDDLYEHYRTRHMTNDKSKEKHPTNLILSKRASKLMIAEQQTPQVTNIPSIKSTSANQIMNEEENTLDDENFNELEAVLLHDNNLSNSSGLNDDYYNRLIDHDRRKAACEVNKIDFENSLSNELNGNLNISHSSNHINDANEIVLDSAIGSASASILLASDENNQIEYSKTSTSLSLISSKAHQNSLNQNLKLQKNDLIRGLIDRKHQCRWCLLRFYTKSQLKSHEATHSNTVLLCPVCDKQFHHKERLSGHMKCHMEPSLECKVCGKKFKRLCNLYNHELVHGLTEHAFMLCQFCGRGFRSRRDYQNHVIANHRELIIKNNECDDTDMTEEAEPEQDLDNSNNNTNNNNNDEMITSTDKSNKRTSKAKTRKNNNSNVVMNTKGIKAKNNLKQRLKNKVVKKKANHHNYNNHNSTAQDQHIANAIASVAASVSHANNIDTLENSLGSTKTTTIVLNNDTDINSLIDIENQHQQQQNEQRSIVVLIDEPHQNEHELDDDTYFTRTGVIQLSRDEDEDQYDYNELNDDENEDHESFDRRKLENNKRMARNNLIHRNNIRRLRSSLNIEVADDDDNENVKSEDEDENEFNENDDYASHFDNTNHHHQSYSKYNGQNFNDINSNSNNNSNLITNGNQTIVHLVNLSEHMLV